jgi:hypothetical protein
MNQKNVKYLLIAGLALVWGTVIFKIIKGLGSKETVTTSMYKAAFINYDQPRDSFTLMLDYSDPFLPGDEDASVADSAVLTLPVKDPLPAKPVYDLSKIQYFGMITNPEQKKKVAILSISGKEYMVKEKDRIDEILIKKITKDKLIVFVDGESKQVNKKLN